MKINSSVIFIMLIYTIVQMIFLLGIMMPMADILNTPPTYLLWISTQMSILVDFLVTTLMK